MKQPTRLQVSSVHMAVRRMVQMACTSNPDGSGAALELLMSKASFHRGNTKDPRRAYKGAFPNIGPRRITKPNSHSRHDLTNLEYNRNPATQGRIPQAEDLPKSGYQLVREKLHNAASSPQPYLQQPTHPEAGSFQQQPAAPDQPERKSAGAVFSDLGDALNGFDHAGQAARELDGEDEQAYDALQHPQGYPDGSSRDCHAAFEGFASGRRSASVGEGYARAGGEGV